MISTIVLMGTLVTLLIVQDGTRMRTGRDSGGRKDRKNEQEEKTMMLTILGCAVAVGLLTNVVKKTMGGTSWKRRKEVNEMLTIVNCVLATACLVRALTRDGANAPRRGAGIKRSDFSESGPETRETGCFYWMKGNERSEQDDLDYICSAAFAPVDCALKHPGEHATGERPGSKRSDFFGIRSGKRKKTGLLVSENPKTKRKETKNADLDYAGPDRCDAGDGSGEGLPEVTAGSPGNGRLISTPERRKK